MPTRPVSWDLDVPPATLLDPVSKTPSVSEAPTLAKLRASLIGTRFEVVKIATFAVFLLALVALAVHGSHLANPENQFVANSIAVARGLKVNISR